MLLVYHDGPRFGDKELAHEVHEITRHTVLPCLEIDYASANVCETFTYDQATLVSGYIVFCMGAVELVRVELARKQVDRS